MILDQQRLFSDDQVTLWGEYERSQTQCGFYAVALPSVIIGDTRNLICTFSRLSFAKLMFILVSKSEIMNGYFKCKLGFKPLLCDTVYILGSIRNQINICIFVKSCTGTDMYTGKWLEN